MLPAGGNIGARVGPSGGRAAGCGVGPGGVETCELESLNGSELRYLCHSVSICTRKVPKLEVENDGKQNRHQCFKVVENYTTRTKLSFT